MSDQNGQDRPQAPACGRCGFPLLEVDEGVTVHADGHDAIFCGIATALAALIRIGWEVDLAATYRRPSDA